MKKIEKVFLYEKQMKNGDDDGTDGVVQELRNYLTNANFEIVERVDENPDLVISIGGDGTYLQACHLFDFNPNILIVGINTGGIGALTDLSGGDLSKLMIVLAKPNEYETIERDILEITLNFRDNTVSTYKGINELKIVEMGVRVFRFSQSDENGEIQRLEAAGICISSDVGSTGFNATNSGTTTFSETGILHNTIIFAHKPINATRIMQSIDTRFTRIEFLEKYGRTINFFVDNIMLPVATDKVNSITVEYSGKIKRLKVNGDRRERIIEGLRKT